MFVLYLTEVADRKPSSGSCSQDFVDVEKRSTASSTRPVDKEVVSCGMPLKRTLASTKLTLQGTSKTRTSNTTTNTRQREASIPDRDRNGANTTKNKSNPNSNCDSSKDVDIIDNIIASVSKVSITSQTLVKESVSEMAVSASLHGTDDQPMTPSNVHNSVQAKSATGKFSYLHQMYEIDAKFEEINSSGFPDWSQRYIFEAYHGKY